MHLAKLLQNGAFALGVIGLLGCGGGGGSAGPAPTPSPAGGESCPIPIAKANPSWAADIHPFIQSSCGSSATSCHGGAGAAGRKDFSLGASALRASLVGQPYSGISGWAYVQAGDPARSWVLEKVAPVVPGEPGKAATGAKIGSQMPLGGSLCAATTDTLRTWIQQGALDN